LTARSTSLPSVFLLYVFNFFSVFHRHHQGRGSN